MANPITPYELEQGLVALLNTIHAPIYFFDENDAMSNIRKSQVNNSALPTNGNVLVYTLVTEVLTGTPHVIYDSTGETKEYQQQIRAQYQLDYYSGANNNETTYSGSISREEATKFSVAFWTDFAGEFLATFHIGVGDLPNNRNLTGDLDRDAYLWRQSVEIDLLYIRSFTPEQLFGNGAVLNELIYADTIPAE